MLERNQRRIKQIQQAKLFRQRITVKNQINFCSNDYLRIGQHPAVKQAFIDGIHQYGLGSGASALVCGYSPAHQMLEERFAEFLQRDRAILFNSGYHANFGVITALASRHDQILVDKLCHASLIDAILLSRSQYQRYAHNQITDLRQRIAQISSGQLLLVTESMFSMEGDLAHLPQLVKIAEDYQATLIVDDAHGIGVLGKNGGGICEHHQLNQQDVPILVAPLGKAFASMGAIVAGSHDMIEALVQFSRTYRYTTALPPAIAHATCTSLKIITSELERREKLNFLIQFFINEAKKRQLPLISTDATPIQAILIKDNDKLLKIQQQLQTRGFLVAAIRPPTVPMHTSRIRISLCCDHSEKDILQLLDLLAEYYHV